MKELIGKEIDVILTRVDKEEKEEIMLGGICTSIENGFIALRSQGEETPGAYVNMRYVSEIYVVTSDEEGYKN